MMQAHGGREGSTMENRGKFYWAKAKPDRDSNGYVGAYGAPGLLPGLVRDQYGKAITFPTEALAEHAAALRLIDVINSLPALARKNGKKPEKYQRLTGPEFAEAMAAADITPTALAYLLAQNLQRIQEWTAGIDEKGNPTAAPHMVRVILSLITELPEALDIAMNVTDSVVSERRPRDARTRPMPSEIDTTPK